MADIAIWPGSSSFANYLVSPGNPTPFGFYDNDIQFQSDADKVSKYCAQRLGYPIQNVELQDINFWTAFEEAVTLYGNEIYAYKVRENYLTLEGGDSTTTINDKVITPNFANIINYTQQYGTEAGVGGNVTWYSGSITLTGSLQDYDLNAWASSSLGISGSELEVRRVFYYPPPPSVPAMGVYDYTPPAPGEGFGMANYGSGTYNDPGTDGSLAVPDARWAGLYGESHFLLMPLNYDLARMQQMDLSETIRRANYSFELINNNLRLFPIPNDNDNGGKLWIQYLIKSDRIANSLTGNSSTISNVGNVPYDNPTYSSINSIGRSWIFEMTLAITKEMLGLVRNKYSSVPVPGDNVTLNGGDLINIRGRDELIERLRTYLDETSRRSMLERRRDESTFINEELGHVPMTIYIG